MPASCTPGRLPGELARRERRRAAAGDRGVEQEDGEHGRDGEGDHEPRRSALASHGASVEGRRARAAREPARLRQHRAMRICSLLPSATEIIADLGLADRLVGVSAECDHPASVRGLPVVTGARIDTSALSSLEIDQAVRDQLDRGHVALRDRRGAARGARSRRDRDAGPLPVCAVSSADVRRVCSVEAEVISLDRARSPRSPRARASSGAGSACPAAASRWPRRCTGASRRCARSWPAGRRRMFLAEWLEPPFAAGHWVPEMVAAAGGRTCSAGPARRRS